MQQKKVSIRPCGSYDLARVKKALSAAIEDIGGLAAYINKGDKVLLKVNLVMKKTPEQAATTHPVFVQALAENLLAYGCEVLIGDSPGGPFTTNALNGIYKATGMADAAAQSGATLNFNIGSHERANPHGLLLRRLIAADMLNDVDKVISVAKLKTHGMMTFTGAAKNMFGVVPGWVKAEYHFNMQNYDDFANAMVDICLCAAPVLSFIDGIIGMEGDGPTAGEPREAGVVMGSSCAFRLDKTACVLIGLPLENVPMLKACMARGLCAEGLEDVDLVGAPLENFALAPFKLPEKGTMTPSAKLPPFVMKILNKTLQPRPAFHTARCTGCRVCVQCCPAKVITMAENRPNIQLGACIRCYCCQELCPQKAVFVKRPRLLQWLTGK